MVSGMVPSPKVLVGCPVSGYHAYCTPEYLAALKNLTYPNYDILLVDNSATDNFYQTLVKQNIPVVRSCYEHKDVKKKIACSRNILREKVLEEKYDYFFSLEQDVIPPPDVIEQLLQRQKPIVSGVYYNYYPIGDGSRTALFPVLYRWLTEEEQQEMRNKQDILQQVNPALLKDLKKNNFDFSKIRVKLTPEDVETQKLMTIKQCGLGCVLIAREVLEKITFRIDEQENTFDDPLFCEDALRHGYELWVDTAIKCKHLVRKRPWSWKELEKQKSL